MITFLVGAVGLVAGAIAGVLVVGLLNAARVGDDANLQLELNAVKQRLASCQEIGEANRQRADLYYELYCEGAKANAQLRHDR